MTRRGWPWPPLFSHRCGGQLAPENTLEAMAVAAEFGTGVEFDVMLSADGTPHLIHDETLDRTTDGHGRVSDTHDAALATLDASAGFDRFRGAQIPLLSDAARRCRELGLAANVEIKPTAGRDRHCGARIAEVVQQCWAGSETPPLLSSFSEAALAAAREVAPDLPRGLLTGALPTDWAERCTRIGAISLHVDARHLTRQACATIRQAGLWLVAYTEDDPQRADALLAWGVNAVITDRPDRLRARSGHS
ncbi:MAG: glycerophosphodiester phosphodiesterase [Pseudazoarcus pumilus]|nr:glycerophosphodiester phosphodiesterase [Pseudazoarcus pumilus]